MAKTKHAVVRTDLMSGTDNRADLVSAMFMGSGETPTDIDNGCIVKVEELMEGEREIYKGVLVEQQTPIADIVLIATPEVTYDEREKNFEDFYNVAGKPCRGYRLRSGNIFSVTKEALGGTTPTKGHAVEVEASQPKMKVAASPTGSTTQIGKIIDIENDGSREYVVIKIA